MSISAVERDHDTEAVRQSCLSGGPQTLVLYRTRPIGSGRQILEAWGARPIQLFEGSRPVGRHLCKFNGVSVMKKTRGIGDGTEQRTGGSASNVGLRARVSSQELGGAQGEHTTAAGDGRHRGSENVIGVSCSGSGAKRWRTELDLGSCQSLDDHHGAATLGTAPKRARFLGSRCLLFYLRLRYRAE